MKIVRRIVSVSLLLFVAASIITIVVQEIRRPPIAEGKIDEGDKVVAYYFHTDVRCVTCETLEKLSTEAMEPFGDRLEWRVVNTDREEHAHFVEDFQLITKSVILTRIRGGERVAWKNLEAIWDLVDDRKAFLRYVREETEAFLRSD
jgi:hypothetical protein